MGSFNEIPLPFPWLSPEHLFSIRGISAETLQRDTPCIAQQAVSSFIGQLSNEGKSKNVSLKTPGKPMKICLRPRQRGLFILQHALDIRKIINASWRCMLKSLEKLRPTLGDISVEPYLSISLVKLSNSFAGLFTLIKTKLEPEPHGLFDCFVVFRSDVHQLITRVCSGGLSINRVPKSTSE